MNSLHFVMKVGSVLGGASDLFK